MGRMWRPSISNPPPPSLQLPFVDLDIEQGLVALADILGGMKDALNEHPVVRQDQEPFALPIEPARGIDALPTQAIREKVHHYGIVFVRHRTDHPHGLVHSHIDRNGEGQLPVVATHIVPLRVDRKVRSQNNFSIDPNPAREDHGLGLAP